MILRMIVVMMIVVMMTVLKIQSRQVIISTLMSSLCEQIVNGGANILATLGSAGGGGRAKNGDRDRAVMPGRTYEIWKA